MKLNKAFTLIELLTVISIIAILSAIILPVLARAKDGAYRSSDMQHLNEIRSALQLYRVDYGAYPPAILGYATIYMSGPNMGQVVPANRYPGHLYSKRIPSLDTLRPVYNRVGPSDVTKSFWPRQDNRPLGAAPLLDLDGDGDIDSADDLALARQAYGPNVVVQAETPIAASPCDGGGPSTDACFYRVSGFDVGFEPDPANVALSIPTLRYARFWTGWGVTGGNAFDDPRQLGYEDPPESTVITWNTFFREYSNGVPGRVKRDQVLFLGGGARAYDSRDVFDRSFRVMP
jgi:prepilin-type N-terminal cleavage/methylation domain-containing protein